MVEALCWFLRQTVVEGQFAVVGRSVHWHPSLLAQCFAFPQCPQPDHRLVAQKFLEPPGPMHAGVVHVQSGHLLPR